MANTHPYDALIVGAGAAGLLCALMEATHLIWS